VEVTLDFSEGFNIALENSQDLKATALIKPMQSDTVAVVRAFDETWANPCKIRYTPYHYNILLYSVVKKSPPMEE
jgi:hypothetical protein